MDFKTALSVASTVSTVMAVIVALGLGIIPAMLARRNERNLAVKRSHVLMVLIQVVVKKYRLYNVQQVIQDGFIQYQYDVNNVKGMTINSLWRI